MKNGNARWRRRRNWLYRKRLKNHDFSIFASNCNGTFICNDLGEPFRSPFVNLWVEPEDFIRFLEQPKAYLAQELRFLEDAEVDYPVAMLGDVKLYFQHYSSPEQARQDWMRRKERINWDNLFVMMTDRDGCDASHLRRFDALPYPNKVVFTHIPQPNIASAKYIPGFEDQECVGICSNYVDNKRGKRFYDSFNFVRWLNRGRKRAVR